jgi:hypothetical protein
MGLDVIWLDAPTGDPETDDPMVRYHARRAVSTGQELRVGGGAYAMLAALDVPPIWMTGCPGRSIFDFPAGSHGIVVGPKTGQTDIGPAGEISGVRVRRASRDTDGAGITLRGVIQVSVRNCRAGGFHRGFDLINNCYGSEFRNCRSLFAENYFAVTLREGSQSGSDITFDNCWMSGQFAAYAMAGGGGGYRITHGQASMGSEPQALPGPTSEGVGVFVMGRDPFTGAKVGLGSVTITQVDVEGWTRFPAIQTYDQVDLVVRDSAFLGTQAGGNAATHIFHSHNERDSTTVWSGNTFTGTLTGAAAVREGVGANSRWDDPPIWRSELPSSVNGVTFDHFNQLQALI